MATPAKQIIKLVKGAPKAVKIKVEAQSDDEAELKIQCGLCTKSFYNEVALRNHLRMEHSGTQVDMQQWVQEAMEVSTKRKSAQKGVPQMALRTAALLESMQPTDMTSLASQDVSYIIIKDEDSELLEERRGPERKRKSAPSREVPARKTARRDREIVPITGPFECLQPSTLVADGQCHQIFFSCCDYSIHFRDEHTRRRKAIKCQVCEKVLASSIGEEATSDYPCLVCGQGCSTRDELTEHTNTAHIKLKPYQCSVCQKRFTQQGGLQQHMRMHTGDRPFNCTFCTKAFTQKSGLDQHLRTHTKVKPYRCVICGKTFVQSVHVKQHMRTHTNVAPFQCVICEQRFKQSSHLNYHLKNHNEANMTDDQKKKYQELIGLMANETDEVTIKEEEESGEQEEESGEQENVPVVLEDGRQVVIEECEDQVYYEQAEDDEVILQDDREYVLSDNGDETWSVKIVN